MSAVDASAGEAGTGATGTGAIGTETTGIRANGSETDGTGAIRAGATGTGMALTGPDAMGAAAMEEELASSARLASAETPSKTQGTQTRLDNIATNDGAGQENNSSSQIQAPCVSSIPASASVEFALRKKLAETDAVIRSLSAEVDSLREVVLQERMLVADANDQKRSQKEYAHKVSKLVRVFRALNVQVPSLDDPNFDAEGLAQLVRQRIQAEVAQTYQPNDRSGEAKGILEMLKIILGASEIVMGDKPNSFKFVLKNEVLDRHMSFWLRWTDANVSYHAIDMRIPETYLPQFAKETDIDFVVAQGPNFFLEIVSSMFISPTPAVQDAPSSEPK